MHGFCQWFFRASRSGRTNLFAIRRFYHIHTCSLDVIFRDHRQATSSIVGECIKQKLLNPKIVYKPKDIVRDMLYAHGISFSYEKAWKEKEKAMELIRGKLDISYDGREPSIRMWCVKYVAE